MIGFISEYIYDIRRKGKKEINNTMKRKVLFIIIFDFDIYIHRTEEI